MGSVMLSTHLTASARKLMQDILDMLQEAGFSRRQAGLAYASVHTYIFGRVGVRDRLISPSARRRRRSTQSGDTSEGDETIRGAEFEEFALNALLSGIESEVFSTGKRQRGTKP
jgi:hypothetical protein